MKSLLVTALIAVLGLGLTSAGAQEPGNPYQDATSGKTSLYREPGVAQTSASQAAPLPLAEAKKRYLATQQQLQEFVKEGGPVEVTLPVGELSYSTRDNLRGAVAEDFDARRQLQQAELIELENRVARIKRALEIRDAMRDTIIDQRTDELLDEMEAAGKTGQRAGAAAPGGGHPRYPGPAGGAANVLGESSADSIEHEVQLLRLAMDEAKAKLEAAERGRERAQRLYQSGAISKEGFEEEDQKWKLAKIELDRVYLKAAAFQEEHGRDRQATKESGGAVNDQPETRRDTLLDVKEAEVDVEEAEAHLSLAKRAYDGAKRMQDKGLSEDAVEAAAIKYKRAQLQLERAKAKLKDLSQPPAGDRAADEHRPTPSAYTPIDPNQIVWGPKDTDAVPVSGGEPIASLELGLVMEPRKAAYKPGDVLTAMLFLRYTGKDRRKIVVPRDKLARLGIDLARAGAAAEKLDWQWGPAHKEAVRGDNVTMAFEPGAIKQLPNIKLVVASSESLGRGNLDPTVFAYLGVNPGQTARLRFELTSDHLTLESEPFEFRVEEPAKEPPTNTAPATDKDKTLN